MGNLYQFHFEEAGAPYPDDMLTHDVFISANNLDVNGFINEVIQLKGRMDSCNYGADPLCDEYGDCGWNEKIDACVELIAQQYPEYGIEYVPVLSYSASIN